MLKRAGVYYHRKAVPQKLRALVGKRELLVCLRTKDKETAKGRLHAAALDANRTLDGARRKLALLTENPERLAERWKAQTFTEEWETRKDSPPRDEDAIEDELDLLDDQTSETRQALAEGGDVGPVKRLLAELLAEYGLPALPVEATRRLTRALLVARLESLEVSRRLALGDFTHEDVKRASLQASAALEGDRHSDPQNNPPLSAVLATWLAERKPPSKTALEVRATFARFTTTCGSDKPIGSVSRADVRAFRESLLAGDAKRGKGKGSLSPASVKKYMNLLGTVFSYAVKTGLLESSPVRGMAFIAGEARQDRSDQKRQPFSEDQLRTLFGSPLYTGSESVSRRTTPGSVVAKDALWWLFPLTLHSGMRIEEAMALRAEDVRDVSGVVCFVVEPRPDRPLKTASSRRVIPVHDTLIRLGLIAERVKGKAGLLFPELRPDARHGTFTAALSKKAGRYLRAIGLPPTITTHSTRHAFTDALRRAKVEPEIRSRLLGHGAGPSTTEQYGAGHDVHALLAAVNSARYENGAGVDQ